MRGESIYRLKQDKFSSHSQIAAHIRNLPLEVASQSFVILDVGCAAGFLRAFLPAPQYRLVGIEGSPELAERAAQVYDTVHVADLNQPLVLPLEAPQAVVLGDILEHLPDPETVLTQLLQQFTKPGTPVIISLPNVAHLYVRLSLLLGRFDYGDRGILDRTHLRFFTLKTAKLLCANCNIRVQSVSVTPIPLPLIHPAFAEGGLLYPLHWVNYVLASAFKGLLGYQFILRGVYEP